MAAPSRSLADDIRGRTDAELVALMLARPDLARPAPADLTNLAARASTKASLQRAIEALDQGHLQVLEALVVAGDGAPTQTLLDRLGATIDAAPLVERLVTDLWRSALLWRGGDAHHVVRAVPEVLGGSIAGLGPPIRELHPAGGRHVERAEDPVGLAALLDAAPPGARAILDRMTWGPSVGVAPAGGPTATSVRWLLERRLLVGSGGDRVVLPREVGLALRGGRIHPELRLEAPELPARTVSAVDAVAGGAASELLTHLDEIAADWGADPPRVLRAGGLSVRDLARTARLLDVDTERAGFLLELLYAAHLLADDGELAPVWAPTPELDEWSAAEAGRRWVALSAAWLRTTRAPHRIGARTAGSRPPASRGAGAAGPVNALGPDVQWPPIRAIRRDVLAELAGLPPGNAPRPDDVLARLLWRRPLRSGPVLADAVRAVLREAEWLGLTGRGALSGAGRALLVPPAPRGAPDRPAGASATRSGPHAELDLPGLEGAAAAMAALLPAPVDHIVLQADLTAIAPGPLEGSLAAFMRLAADIESRGGATVYRFTPESVRRTLDAGWSAAELTDTLRRSSSTALPQPLEYLVSDVARKHGRTRVGGTAAYIRSDDATVLEGMLVARELRSLRLRRIAPTVLVSPADPQVLTQTLHEAGFAPVRESIDGSVILGDAPRRRARARRAAATTVRPVDEPFTRALVTGLRAAEEAADARRAEEERRSGPRIPMTDPVVTLALLRDAVAEGHAAWIGVTDRHGAATRELVHPSRIEGGRVHATDAAGHERTYSIHRITGAALDDGS